jgi:hypothetical protein
MYDLDSRILAVAELDRVPMIERLIAFNADAGTRTRMGRCARLGTATRTCAEEARTETERLGRIISFLRFRKPPTGLTHGDARLCETLAGKLRAKGQWTGEYSL